MPPNYITTASFQIHINSFSSNNPITRSNTARNADIIYKQRKIGKLYK
jgi:hypothetical protein